MKSLQAAAAFLLLLFSGHSLAHIRRVTFYLHNKCPSPTWPATAPSTGHPVIADDGFYLPPGKTEHVESITRMDKLLLAKVVAWHSILIQFVAEMSMGHLKNASQAYLQACSKMFALLIIAIYAFDMPPLVNSAAKSTP
ncbi:hypothetical protein DITRI_Ditri09bG0036600 [Diplodiscus trichospermus]